MAYIFTKYQSGSLPGDFFTCQLLSVIHKIQSSFDSNSSQGVTVVFLDNSQTAEKVSNKGLIFKLKANGIEHNLLKLSKKIPELL